MQLRFLYLGSDDTDRDVAGWLQVPGARTRWRFRNFGADVAGIDLGGPPLVLVADHRPAGSILPIYSVEDLGAAVAALDGKGWTAAHGPLDTPEGPASVLSNGSGTLIALLQVDRPDVLDSAYTDQDNGHAVRPPPA